MEPYSIEPDGHAGYQVRKLDNTLASGRIVATFTSYGEAMAWIAEQKRLQRDAIASRRFS
jgi:hypothetical protein